MPHTAFQPNFVAWRYDHFIAKRFRYVGVASELIYPLFADIALPTHPEPDGLAVTVHHKNGACQGGPMSQQRPAVSSQQQSQRRAAADV